MGNRRLITIVVHNNNTGHTNKRIIFIKAHKANSLGTPPNQRNPTNRKANNDSLMTNKKHLVTITHSFDACNRIISVIRIKVFCLNVHNTPPSARYKPIVFKVAALTKSILGNAQKRSSRNINFHTNDTVSRSQTNTANTCSTATNRGNSGFIKTKRKPIFCCKNHSQCSWGEAHLYDFVTISKTNCNNSCFPWPGIKIQICFFQKALFCREKKVVLVIKRLNWKDCSYVLSFLQRKKIDKRLAFSITGSLWNLICVQPIHTTKIRKEKKMVKVTSDEKMLNKIFFFS